MADILLIRHGQASFGAADYDQLSSNGETQSRLLGSWLAAYESPPSLIATGQLRRHAQTADACVEASGVDAPRLVLAGLDELDHQEILLRNRPDLPGHAAIVAEVSRSDDPHRTIVEMFLAAVKRWASGQHDHEYTRPWPQFRMEAIATLQTLAEQAADASEPIWVFTSGGPIAVMVGELLGIASDPTLELSWSLVNTSLTRIGINPRKHLITYNAWPHLAGHAELITHR